jgi:hypothetical protein
MTWARARLALAVMAVGALLLVAPARAHRGHDALSVIVLEPDGRVRVSHRLEASDLEPALLSIAPEAQPSLDDPDAVAAVIAYLARRFQLTIDDRPVVLVAAGTQLEGAIVQFDFVGRTRGSPKQLTIASQLLTDIHPRQVNQVNVRRGKAVQTLTFRQGGSQTVTIR